MGNKNTKNDNINNNNESIKEITDETVIHYILTMDHKSLSKMYEIEYCDKLVILTSKILENNLSLTQLLEIAKQIKPQSREVNAGINRQLVSSLEIERKQLSLEIAKFYIQIAHLYAIIIKTINPMYVYKNSLGEVVRVPLSEKNSIPNDASVEIKPFNICEKNIELLKHQKNDYEEEEEEKGAQYANETRKYTPNSCELSDIEDSLLIDEPGIPELLELYKDDNYDYSSGEFKGMSEKTKNEYLDDLLLFYNVFTGNNLDKLPDDINTFSDIKLTKYKIECNKGENNKMNFNNSSDNVNVLFKEYAENIKVMLENMHKNREALLKIINILFVYKQNIQTGEKEITINNKLKENDIPDLILETRRIIIELYLTCEQDYLRGMEIYEAIVNKRVLETTEKQIQYFEAELDKIHE